MTRRILMLVAFYMLAVAGPSTPAAAAPKSYKGADFDLTAASVTYLPDLELLFFEQRVAGAGGGTTPEPRGQLHGAPVLGYVFPTTLKPDQVGFGGTGGILALAVASHPDFDDTPLWDENSDGNFGNDGVRWHTHWVVLVEDTRVPGGLSVKEFRKADAVVLPPTNPGMPMYMDLPGHAVLTRGDTLKVLVPASRIAGDPAFRFDAVTAYLEVFAPAAGHGAGHDKPMLGVYEVFEVLSGDLSLPSAVARHDD